MTLRNLSSVLLATLIGAVAALATLPVMAVEYTITISNDNDTVNGDCSLREALYAATDNLARDACPAGSPTVTDRITLHTGVTFDGGMYYMNGVQGGPLVIQGSTPDPTDTVINLVWANRFLYLLSGDPVTVKNLQIVFGDGAAPSYGGVIRCANTSLTLDTVSFGLSSAVYGGAVSFLNTTGAEWLHIQSSTLTASSADGDYNPAGGALWVDVAGSTEVRIIDSTISGNTVVPTSATGAEGGGAWISAAGDASVVIADSLFDDNSGENDNVNRGAGLWLELYGSATAEIRDTTFSNNHWDYPSPTTWDATDGAYLIANGDSRLLVERCIFEDNLSPNAGFQYQLRFSAHDTAIAHVASSVFVGGSRAVYASNADASEVVLSHLTVTGNEWTVTIGETGTGSTQLNNSILSLNNSNLPTTNGGAHAYDNFIGGDPLFVDASTGNYRLQSISPAIDNGNQSRPGVRFCDLDHAPRVVGDETDQGAYESGGLFADDYETGDISAWD